MGKEFLSFVVLDEYLVVRIFVPAGLKAFKKLLGVSYGTDDEVAFSQAAAAGGVVLSTEAIFGAGIKIDQLFDLFFARDFHYLLLPA